ncbi:MAG: hypothetical protein SBU_000103 [Candidatus Syntrophoarchaeum butanivorans]|uniref:Uncharacterized protein n=1 Tax=Candidatus Syntropharchaeum butanivorans TaxID=1839936 RepID=A0A1F2P686_9EURY|nr:MAG: hypothetical protein SBU_000103 [Candidatus Syntrophoarchaeum butanivorans]
MKKNMDKDESFTNTSPDTSILKPFDSAHGGLEFDALTVRQVYRFLAHQSLTEIRGIDPNGEKKPVIYFVKDEDDFVDRCRQLNGDYNVYVGINPRKQRRGRAEDIAAVNASIIDVDARRPDSKQPATDEELEKAEEVADQIIEWFESQGFHRPIKCMSGNGFQLWSGIPPIELDDENREAVQAKLQAFQKLIKEKFENDRAEIDNIGDLPRIIKVIGTRSIKGEDTPERPHRLSYAVDPLVRSEDERLRDYILNLEVERDVQPANPPEVKGELRPCFKQAIEQRWQLTGGDGHHFRLALVAELVAAGYTDQEIHEVFKLQADYDSAVTQSHIDRTRVRGIRPHRCATIQRDCASLVSHLCELCKERKNTKSEESTKEGGSKPKSQNDRLVSLALSLLKGIGCDQYDEPHAIIENEKGTRALRIRSREFKEWLARVWWEAEQKTLSNEALTTATTTLSGIARFDGSQFYLWNRIGEFNGKIYYDLANEAGEVIEIDESGWRITTDPPILFRREQHQRPQARPEHGGRIERLWDFFTIENERDRRLLLTAVISYFFPEIPRPIIVFYGQHGSRKTTFSKWIKDLIDPSKTETLRMPTRDNDMIIALFHHYCAVFDNEGMIRDWQSDVLARAVTGAGETKRALYTDEDEVIYNYKRAIVLNGILIPLYRPDVVDRSLFFKLTRREDNRSERGLQQVFEATKPQLFGALLDLLSKTLRVLKSEKIRIPGEVRMFDYAEVGEACLRALGYEAGTFLEDYLSSKGDDNIRVVESSIMGSVLLALINDRYYINEEGIRHNFLDGERQWQGTASELLQIFNLKAKELGVDRRSREWKGSPKGLSEELERLKTNLAAIGVMIERGKSGERFINIYKKSNNNHSHPHPLSNVNLASFAPGASGPGEVDEPDAEMHTLKGRGIADPITGTDDLNTIIRKLKDFIQHNKQLLNNKKRDSFIEAATSQLQLLGLLKRDPNDLTLRSALGMIFTDLNGGDVNV